MSFEPSESHGIDGVQHRRASVAGTSGFEKMTVIDDSTVEMRVKSTAVEFDTPIPETSNVFEEIHEESETQESDEDRQLGSNTTNNNNNNNNNNDNDNDNEDDDDDYTEYPEGGLMAWRVVLGSFFGLFSVFGLINSLGAIQAYVNVNQLSQRSDSQVSWIFSVFLFLCYLLAGQVGPLFDAYGPYQLVIAGTCFYTLGIMMTSLATEYYQFFLAFSLCAGLGCALLMTPEIAIIGHWFKKRRGTAIGAATVGGSLGGVIFPVMLRQMYSTAGYAWALRALGFINLGTLLLSLFLMKPRLESVTPATASGKSKMASIFSVKNMADVRSLRDMRYAWLVAGNFLGELGVVNGLTFITSYALAQGKSPGMSYALLAILNAVGMPGRWLPGLIADRWLGRFNTLILTTIMAFLTIFIIWLPFGHTTAGLVIFCVLHGFCNGAILSLSPVCCGQICKTRDYGKRYGTMFFITSFACLLGIPLSGALIHGTNYNNLVIFNGSLYVGTTLALLMSRYYAVGFRLCKW
ncbi:uncharacterized protein SAPINGB_P003510 [Magnusiomyces paraingens]|uniref:Major facilitator superfamily (MFS) profile domain-containing protein n=1 Tax=Magnusiomyces paraingens TaxID=2606893 RepID=A0A5E8BPP9_9ASCO|nr:uncharacterized protein SAPINGB_P003510 [Saprochaete ingens]VVT53313.1 unnamed protein product [Saprochaete ingens]